MTFRSFRLKLAGSLTNYIIYVILNPQHLPTCNLPAYLISSNLNTDFPFIYSEVQTEDKNKQTNKQGKKKKKKKRRKKERKERKERKGKERNYFAVPVIIFPYYI